MTLRGIVIVYLVLLHLVIVVLGVLLLWSEHRPWLLLLEAGLVLSVVAAVLLLRSLRMPQELVTIGSEWLREGDFSHTFSPEGAADLQRLVGLYNDMVQRLRQERLHLQERELFLHQVLAASPSGVVTADLDGRIATVNPAAGQLLGRSPEELQGRRPDELGELLGEPLLQEVAAVPVGESRLLGRRGQRRLRCSHRRFFDRGFERSLYLLEDLTHELWESERTAYQTLVRTLSHEVNNTLGATSSILRSVLAYGGQLGGEDRDDFSNALRVAIERSDHLGAFMRRYAEVVRLPAPQRRPTDLIGLLRRIAGLMEAECSRHRVRLRFNAEGELPPQLLDEVQMEQVFVNLVRNALEAIGSDGEIDLQVAAGQKNGAPSVIISDTGPGLSQEAREHLFTPFFSTKPQGQGIGLTLVQEILARHGFAHELISRPGEPTRFVIWFTGSCLPGSSGGPARQSRNGL